MQSQMCQVSGFLLPDSRTGIFTQTSSRSGFMRRDPSQHHVPSRMMIPRSAAKVLRLNGAMLPHGTRTLKPYRPNINLTYPYPCMACRIVRCASYQETVRLMRNKPKLEQGYKFFQTPQNVKSQRPHRPCRVSQAPLTGGRELPDDGSRSSRTKRILESTIDFCNVKLIS